MTTTATAENQPLGLGAALASISNKEDTNSRGRHQGVSLEEHVETGIGVQYDNEDEVLSVQHQEFRKSTTARPKRSSLIERSREFKEKFVQFMQDYDDDDKMDKKSCYNDVDLEASNRFPTREVDLRHVDQGVNLMDASSARHEWRDGESAHELYCGDEHGNYDTEDYGHDNGDYDDDDVYAGYTQGFTAASKEEPAIAGCGGIKTAMDNHECDVIKVERRISITKNRSKYRCDWGWAFIFLMLVMAAVLLATVELIRGDDSSSVSNSLPPATPVAAIHPSPTPHTPGTSEHDVERRTLVLKHIVREELAKGSHAASLNPSHPSAKKAITWMTTYDSSSMKLLDDFDFHPTDGIQDKQGLLKDKEDIDAPSNHADRIIERYVEVVFYFEAHPQATPQTAVLH